MRFKYQSCAVVAVGAFITVVLTACCLKCVFCAVGLHAYLATHHATYGVYPVVIVTFEARPAWVADFVSDTDPASRAGRTPNQVRLCCAVQ